ncbi:MAG TPA: pyridoxal phosphate-dependent aminotransferase [Candidatus Atribacteria bacterium]|nr:pyridoxal phosphate-dependent aminotransferase [Candidatus Atribacteria bacterium]
MKYDFDKVIDRTNYHSVKWDELDTIFGAKDILPMWVADMEFRSPKPVIEAIRKAAEHGIYGYTSRPDSYYQAIIGWMEKRHHWKVKKDWLAFSPGVVPALSFIIRAFTEPGDKVVIQPPVYYPFFRVIENNGCHVVNNPLKFGNKKYFMDYDDLERKVSDPRVKLLILCSPHNPVGRVWQKEELIILGEICIKHNIMVVSDEIHADILFKGHKHTPFAKISPAYAHNSITCTAPSKTFNLAGLQTSTIIIPNKKYYKIYQNILDSLTLNENNVFGLVALESAFRYGEEWLEQLLTYLKTNLEFLSRYFRENIPKIKVIKPEGTYLIWLDCRQLGLNVQDLNNLMINKAKVALDDGCWFGIGGEGFMRINIACPRSMLEEGLKRIERAVNSM